MLVNEHMNIYSREVRVVNKHITYINYVPVNQCSNFLVTQLCE